MLATPFSVLDFVDLADKLMATLICPQAIPDCCSRIMAVMKGNNDPYNLKTTTVHLRNVALVNEDVWLFQAIDLPLLCFCDPNQEMVRMIFQPLTEFAWRQPRDVRALGIFDAKPSEFLNDGNADQATTHELVDFVTPCWAKNHTEYEPDFTRMTRWLFSIRLHIGVECDYCPQELAGGPCGRADAEGW
jgi:hypothetical protein